MINYHFKGKIGILKAIVNTAYQKHRDAMDNLEDNQTPEQRVRAVIKNFVEFFRNNTELALVAFDTHPFSIPEIIELKMQWGKGNIERLIRLFEEHGLNPENDVHVSLFNGLIGNTILAHFRGCFAWEESTHKPVCFFNDAFYKRYADTLATFYLNGIKAVVAKDHKKK
jgi:AcrR family transcriptional regulator